jgi:inorganic pyrophosphatase
MPVMMENHAFWLKLDELVTVCKIVIDRPQGTSHPRYPSLIYPLDYGYLESTGSGDGEGIDVWVGSLPERRVTAIICTLDMQQRDAEVKILLSCTPWEAQTILAMHNTGAQAGILVEREDSEDEVYHFRARERGRS